jgi:hypothetical protein
MSQVNQNKKMGGGGACPQWMRTLEEKYQKLHKKITENTSNIGYGRFNSCVGRTVYDARLSQALLRYKDSAIQRHNLKSKSKSTCKISDTNNNNETGNIPSEFEQNQYLKNTVAINSVNETANNCEENEKYRSSSPKLRQNCGSSSDKEDLWIDNASLDSDSEEDSARGAKNRFNKEIDKLTAGEFGTNVISSSDKVKAGCTSDIDKLDTSKHCRRNLKTSLSRTSKVTSKSCPAKIQSKSLERTGQKRLLLSRSKSANRNAKMFTPMSEEAKHAITETIHEMNYSAPGRTERSGVNFIPSRGRKCVKTWAVPKKMKSASDGRKVLESASQCLADLHSDGANLNERNSADENDSCRSSGGTLPEGSQKSNSRLPDIQSGSARDRNNTRSSSYRLPGIGKYDITQEDPIFEITPPGFDSRYNDMQVVEERESETPPPDIRQRAIDKCSEWLTKYNK